MISYTDWVDQQYGQVRRGGVVRDHYAQIIIRDADVVEQMALHNKTQFTNAVRASLDIGITSPFARQALIDLFRDAFYQLAAKHESELRRVYEGRTKWKLP